MQIQISSSTPPDVKSILDDIESTLSEIGIPETCAIKFSVSQNPMGQRIMTASIYDPVSGSFEIKFGSNEINAQAIRDKIASAWSESVGKAFSSTVNAMTSGRDSNYTDKPLEVIDAFRAKLMRLYAEIVDWMTPYTQNRSIQVDYGDATPIVEHRLPPYELMTLHIRMPNGAKVSIIPRGIIVIGAEGRLNMTGTIRELMIVLQDGEWYFVNRENKVSKWKLTRDSFIQALHLLSA